jgi:transposase
MILSIDLRERVIAAVDRGIHIDKVKKRFGVCRKTIYNWLNLRKETNSLAPKKNYQKGHSHKITDLEQFKKFAEDHKQCSLSQMTIKWEELFNQSISESSILRALKKIGFTSKKKRMPISSLI